MAKVYSGVDGIKAPEFMQDFDKYEKACDEYVEAVKACAKKNNPTCPEAGEEIYFPVADGNARYIVYNLKPVELIHLHVMDAWHFQYANRLTAKDVRNEIGRQQALAEIFGGKKNLVG